MTQLEMALGKKSSEQLRSVCRLEGFSLKYLKGKLVSGRVVIPNNNRRRIKGICGIGEGLRTKINVNIGTSTDKSDLTEELNKLKVSLEYGADTVMDLSTAGDIPLIRKAILKASRIPVGTVPVYEAAVESTRRRGSFLKMRPGDILEVIKSQADDGVDFMTIHSGVTRKTVDMLKRGGRILDIVSRGGAILTSWMAHNKSENPFYTEFDRILDIAYQYDITLSLGDGLRPGAIADATDSAQLSELKCLGNLAQRARQKKVQVIIEGPGHVPLNQIKKNIELEKNLCHHAPFYVLGPLVTDIASTKDHISGAIGSSLAASFGADFLCVVTPAEHLRHPTVEDIKEGVIASRIAAHSADIVKGVKGAAQWDKEMSLARKERDWEKQLSLSIDPRLAREYRKASRPRLKDVCTMCSEYCSIKLIEECLRV